MTPEPGTTRRARLGPPLGRPRWSFVVLGYLLALLGGWAYGAGLRAGGDWHTGARWEHTLLLTLRPRAPEALDAVLYAIPWAGTNLTLGPLVAVLAVWLLWQRRRDLATWLVVAELGVLSLNWLLKHLLERERPNLFERVGWFGWASYPSGHAMSSLAVLGTFAILAHRATGRRWPLVAAIVTSVVISCSRLYHGVHWPTDLIGGTIVGLVWLLATWFAFVLVPDAPDGAGVPPSSPPAPPVPRAEA